MSATVGGAGRAIPRSRYRGVPADLVLDVRTKIEFWLGHIPGAVCIPIDQLPDALQGRPGTSLTSRIVVYCASGARSAAAATQLRSAGYTNVVDAGGIGAAREHITP